PAGDAADSGGGVPLAAHAAGGGKTDGGAGENPDTGPAVPSYQQCDGRGTRDGCGFDPAEAGGTAYFSGTLVTILCAPCRERSRRVSRIGAREDTCRADAPHRQECQGADAR